MTYLEPKELIQARQFIMEGKFEESLQLLKDFEERRNNSLHDIVSCHLIKCDLLFHQGFPKKLVKLAEQTYKESLGLEKSILSVDALICMAWGYGESYNFKPVNKIIKQAEELLATLTEELVINKTRREAYIVNLKGAMSNPGFSPKGDVDLALKYYKHSLALGESLGDDSIVCFSLIPIAWQLGLYKGEFDHALEYAERALAFSKEANYKFFIAWGFLTKATLYHNKGDVARSIPLYEQGLAIAKELNNERLITTNLNNMADAYRMNGELDHALNCSEQCLAQFSEIGDTYRMAWLHDYLIQILIEKGDLERAQQYFSHLEQLNNQLKDKTINLSYLYNKALILKESPRISNKGKAEEILKQILEEKDISWELKERALLTLCELLIIEFQMSNEVEVLDELKSLIERVLETAEKSKSYWILCETYLLQSKMALISSDLEEARRLLAKGQQIAEKFGLNRLAIKISNEHDELLKKLDVWDKLKESKASLSERMELARLNEQVGQIIRRRELELPDLPDEDPIVLLIISEGGRPVFSESFVEEWAFDDHLFGGFLTAVNSFSDEMFSEGLNRANFGEYTIIMNSLSPFLVCYLFKGQSYLAQQRVKKFIDNIKKDKNIWKTFNEYNQTCRVVQLEDVPSLEPLITKIFIEKSAPPIA